MASKFRNSGQTCVCANRFFVHESVHDEFLDKFSAAIETLNVGDGSADGVTQGPLINGAALDKIDGLVAGAVASGAVVHLGGRRSDAGANFFEPTLLSGVTDSMVVAKDEIFGPGECKVVEYRHAALLEFLSFQRTLGRCCSCSCSIFQGRRGGRGACKQHTSRFGGVPLHD